MILNANMIIVPGESAQKKMFCHQKPMFNS